VRAPILVVGGPAGVGKTTVARLVAAAFDRSAHVPIDDFLRFVASGWAEPWVPANPQLYDVVGGAFVAASLQFAKAATP
jgi:2-phosphoglycerate kinase